MSDTQTPPPAGTAQTIAFPNGNKALLLSMTPGDEPGKVLEALSLNPPSNVILVLGNADLAIPQLESRLFQLFSRGFARVVAQLSAGKSVTLVDEGIASTLVDLLGRSFADRNVKIPMLGIAPEGRALLPPIAAPQDGKWPLEPNHSHFVLVKGANAGDESASRINLVATLSDKAQPLAILVGGDDIAKREILACTRRDYPIIVVKGSGDLADKLVELVESEPDFVEDPMLAEIVADGNLHFFNLTETPEEFGRQIMLQLNSSREKIIQKAKERYKLYSHNAERFKNRFQLLQLAILILGVFGAGFAVLQTFAKQVKWDSWVTDTLYFLVLGVPAIVTVLIAGANFFNMGSKWVLVRAATDAVKREMFRYRTRSGSYSLKRAKKDGTTPEMYLSNMLEAISHKWLESEVTTSSLQEPDKTKVKKKKPEEKASATDDGVSFLTPEEYLEFRLENQRIYYRKKAKGLDRLRFRLQWAIFLFSGTSTVIAAISKELLIPVITALVGAITTYLEYMQVTNTLKQYNRAAQSLENIRDWWVALTPDQQAEQVNIDKLVDITENTLQSEQIGWVQQMQTALSDLQKHQAEKGEDNSDAAKTGNSSANGQQRGKGSSAQGGKPETVGSEPSNA
ncbi:MAG: DUF4231 domain-containing protein [Chloroflexi bacterium]|uniref:DUF4231 domain-containing protein n=1 Tax=Candidatus Chlorohelix allophototropha TaxID=3003348 RepID=A0A8T7MAG2_9CHLR|nr:DUF4231 domain-containing protein [Chloroflexota bacterium]WJW70429.1 DUF4231 domain-containing protein [Chloroflexota bacterium L227-S17]